jgi:ABC transporter substrate binding protein
LYDGSAAFEALQRQTRTAPIVLVTVGDPVGQKFVQSLARPGGNITGFSAMDASAAEKWLEMLTQLVPSVKSVAVVYNPATIGQLMIHSVEDAAPPPVALICSVPAGLVTAAVRSAIARAVRDGCGTEVDRRHRQVGSVLAGPNRVAEGQRTGSGTAGIGGNTPIVPASASGCRPEPSPPHPGSPSASPRCPCRGYRRQP